MAKADYAQDDKIMPRSIKGTGSADQLNCKDTLSLKDAAVEESLFPLWGIYDTAQLRLDLRRLQSELLNNMMLDRFKAYSTGIQLPQLHLFI